MGSTADFKRDAAIREAQAMRGSGIRDAEAGLAYAIQDTKTKQLFESLPAAARGAATGRRPPG